MLMDEPFSAVDPITRLRLQNDFLRLHRAVPKTVVMVSHDIDEAVRMADRIAVMREGRLVQYAAPAELLARPADEFVSNLLGADRALKGLALIRVEDIPWAPADGVDGTEPQLDPLMTLRDALSAILGAGSGHGVVIDGNGRSAGLVSAEDIARHARGEASPADAGRG
jgi:osmoprotectant transport system ATP-binding protein